MKKIKFLIILIIYYTSINLLISKDIITMQNSYRLDCDFNGSILIDNKMKANVCSVCGFTCYYDDKFNKHMADNIHEKKLEITSI